MNLNEIKIENYDNHTFGTCIRQKREELGLSVRALAKTIGMSPVYLSDIERGNRAAPTGANSRIDYMSNLVKALELQPDEVHTFYTMAEMTYGRYSNINSYLAKNPAARIALRMADEQNIPEEEWQKFIDRLRELNPNNK